MTEPPKRIPIKNIGQVILFIRIAGIIFALVGLYLVFSHTDNNPFIMVIAYVAVFIGLLLSPMAQNHPEGFPKILIIITLLMACFGYSTIIYMEKNNTNTINKFCDDAPDNKPCIKIQSYP